MTDDYPGFGRAAPIGPRPAPPLWIAAAVLPLALAACGGRPDVRPAQAPPPSAPPSTRVWDVVAPGDPAAANSVVIRAIGLVGTPYRFGGNTPEGGFDCSGLVHYVYSDMLDLRLPRTSRELAAVQGPRIAPDRLAAGDLVFFGPRGNVTHVGIYVGEGRFVHAPSSGGTVRLDHLDGHYWRDNYSGSRRVL
ncbi:C40 family peptidase [Luteimonas abyssi]|uniref:C40 family peptidase n=1 Tax=Luteimonas abyssi TaxID=1247514 RepID=UPI0009E772E9|nr:C40 family peptidase [Luteimonas abyssi]